VQNRRAILASNTSYLDVHEIAAPAPRALRIVIGLHFFSLRISLKLLEVVVAEKERQAGCGVATGFALARR